MTKRKRVLIWLGSSSALIALYAWFFGVATMLAIEARYVGRKFPVVKRTPAPLSDFSRSTSQGQKVTYAGYEFEVPWAVDDKRTNQISPTSEVIAFDSGKALWFSRVPPREFLHTFLRCAGIDPAALRQLYGDALDSDYSIHKLILDTTPRKISPFTSRKEAGGGAVLLMMKIAMMAQGGETGIYDVQTNDFRGFQYGDPRLRPKLIDVEVFAQDGGLAFLFSQTNSGPAPAVTQAEINRVVQSVHKVPENNLSASH